MTRQRRTQHRSTGNDQWRLSKVIEVFLRVLMALVGCHPVPPDGFDKVLLHTTTVLVHESKAVMRINVALIDLGRTTVL